MSKFSIKFALTASLLLGAPAMAMEEETNRGRSNNTIVPLPALALLFDTQQTSLPDTIGVQVLSCLDAKTLYSFFLTSKDLNALPWKALPFVAQREEVKLDLTTGQEKNVSTFLRLCKNIGRPIKLSLRINYDIRSNNLDLTTIPLFQLLTINVTNHSFSNGQGLQFDIPNLAGSLQFNIHNCIFSHSPNGIIFNTQPLSDEDRVLKTLEHINVNISNSTFTNYQVAGVKINVKDRNSLASIDNCTFNLNGTSNTSFLAHITNGSSNINITNSTFHRSDDADVVAITTAVNVIFTATPDRTQMNPDISPKFSITLTNNTFSS